MFDTAQQLIQSANNIVIIQAENPDGDSLGSSLALEEVLSDLGKTVIASTASPYKFPVVAVEAVTGKSGLTDFEALAQLHKISGVAVPPAVDGLETATVVL